MLKCRKEKLSKKICADEISYYLDILKEPIVDYDCAILCKKSNKNIPYCCKSNNAVPLLYKAEYEYLRTLGDLWLEWIPKNKDDRELLDYARDDQIFAECKGIKYCVREQRSITCRVFPLEPYIDLRGVFVALTFMESFLQEDKNTGTKCPLALHKEDIRQEFIDTHFLFWQNILLRLPDEYRIYKHASASIRKFNKNNNTEPIVFFPSWHKNIKSMHGYLNG